MDQNSGSETAEVNVRRKFGGNKGVAMGIQQAWQGKGMGRGSRMRKVSWYAGTETGDAWVGRSSSVGKRCSKR